MKRADTFGTAGRSLAGTVLAVCLLTGLAPVFADEHKLPLPSSLQQAGQQIGKSGKPLVMLVSLPGCAYCHEVRENYLRELGESGKAVLAEIELGGRQRLTDFQGKSVSEAELAQRYKVKVAPTVLMLDASGKLLAEPLVGSGRAGFYGAYLDNALQAASRSLTARSGN